MPRGQTTEDKWEACHVRWLEHLLHRLVRLCSTLALALGVAVAVSLALSPASGIGAAWSQDTQDQRRSSTTFLSKQLQDLQSDPSRNPAALWSERGSQLWQAQCASCHGDVQTMRTVAGSFPKLAKQTPRDAPADKAGVANTAKTLINLEDQIGRCLQRPAAASQSIVPNDDERVLALSSALHDAAKGQGISPQPAQTFADPQAHQADQAQWRAHLERGQLLYNTRMGRINLACAHCHDGKVGSQMRADTISQGHPTGFPIYRMSWQTVGSLERRLRACYSGVQAPLPPAGSLDLRDLELFLKIRAKGMPIEGSSVRR